MLRQIKWRLNRFRPVPNDVLWLESRRSRRSGQRRPIAAGLLVTVTGITSCQALYRDGLIRSFIAASTTANPSHHFLKCSDSSKQYTGGGHNHSAWLEQKMMFKVHQRPRLMQIRQGRSVLHRGIDADPSS